MPILRLHSILFMLLSIFAFKASGQTTATGCSLKYDSVLNRSYYLFTEQMPQYVGGDSEMLKTIINHLRYPSNDCCFTGSIYVAFIIEPDCSISDKRILNNKSDICKMNKQALKALDYLTEWIPGKCNGKNVPVQITLPIRFSLQ